MGRQLTLLVISDPHYAGPGERERRDFEARAIHQPILRLISRLYRHHIWLANPLAHNGKLDQVLRQSTRPDLTVALGDYSCDSAFIGVSDDAACASAHECLGRLRQQFAPHFMATLGDHELGKFSLFGGVGGLRLASFHRATRELGILPFWRLERGRYVLVGIASSLVAFPVFERESLPEERPKWWQLRQEHLEQIRDAFRCLAPSQKVLLFCHDPSALPFLARDETLGPRLEQIERTFIGHLHTPLVFRLSQWLAGVPAISFLGNSARRMTTALREARLWKPFHPTLCPSLAGTQLLKDGGYLTLTLDEDAHTPVQVQFHPLPWQQNEETGQVGEWTT